MAGNWWDEAYKHIQSNWSINADQQNKDRQAYQDSFMMNTAEKGMNYELTSRLLQQSTDHERDLMGAAADLDRRNTLDLMTGEHNFKLAGMQESNRLSKDFLAAQGYQERETMAEQGNQARRTQEVQNKGMADVEGIRAATANYAQDSESRRVGLAGQENRETARITGEQDRLGYRVQGEEQRAGIRTTGEEERLNIGARGEQDRMGYRVQGEEQRAGIRTTGEEERLNIGARGREERAGIRTTGDETRRTTAFEREHAAGLATRMTRR